MKQGLAKDLTWVLGFVVVIWVVELINWTLGHSLSQYGILPRTTSGLVGIPLSPFLHAGLGHAALNTVPVLVLGALVALRGVRVFLTVSVVIALLGGAAVWLAARGAYHVGASGLIFGYFGYLVARGWLDRRLGSLAVAGVTVFLYGGLIWGVLPTVPNVSWEGHLFGLAAGVAAARLK